MMKNTIKKTIFRNVVATSVFAAFALPLTATAGDDFQAAWDAAEAKRKEAAKIGAEWRDTGKMLKQAKSASEKGETE